MSQKIESDKLFIKDIFSKWYRIPEYQRPYVWGTGEVTDLMDDIEQARATDPSSQYFLGSMVLQKSVKEKGGTIYEEFDLLDGQQRLTTLFLITAVLRDLTPEANTTLIKLCNDAIYQMEVVYDNIPERLRIIFDIRDEVKDFINGFVKERGGSSRNEELKRMASDRYEDVSIRNMANALLVIREYLSSRNIDEFFRYLRSNVLMIYVAAENLDDAFRLFTVMNNRGIKLRNSDILKAENLAMVKDASARIDWAKRWEEAESYFGEDFDNFLSYLRTILVKQKASYNLLTEFKEIIYNPKSYDRVSKTYSPLPALLEKGKSTFEFVHLHYKNYQQLFDQDNFDQTGNFELKNYLHLMQMGFEADFWIAALLRYFERFRTDHLTEFVKALDNKFANDWLLGYTPSERIEKVNAIIRCIDVAERTADVIGDASLFVEKDGLDDALTNDIYGDRAAKYILMKVDLLYHGHNAPIVVPDTISVEHILPQNPSAGSQWLSDFSEGQRKTWTNKLGNLVLISRRKNSSQSNRDYAEKKEKYFKKNIELFSNSVRVYNNFPSWTPADLERNHTEVLDKLKWSFGI